MGNRMLLSLRAVFYSDHSMVPGKNDANMMHIERQDTEVTIQTQNSYSEFDSFFGEGKSAKNQPIAGFPITVETVVNEDPEKSPLTGDTVVHGQLFSNP